MWMFMEYILGKGCMPEPVRWNPARVQNRVRNGHYRFGHRKGPCIEWMDNASPEPGRGMNEEMTGRSPDSTEPFRLNRSCAKNPIKIELKE
jgi:hypothetical protein